MTVRDLIGRYHVVTLCAIGVVLLLVVLLNVRSIAHRREPVFATRVFYTTDDGSTLFADDAEKIAPFDHEGHEAVRAYVFTSDNGEHQWVQYLEKYSANDTKPAEPVQNPPSPDPTSAGNVNRRLVKRPGDGKWISWDDPKAEDVMRPVAPEGFGSAPPYTVVPK